MELERTIHWIGVAAGAAVLCGGLVLLFAPGIARSVPFGFLVAEIATLLAFPLAIWVARQRYRSRQNRTVVPDVEFALATPTPGDEIDDLVYRLTELREGTIEYRERIQERVAELAIAVLMDREDCSRERAIELLEEGTWTDDGVAAAFFTGGAGGAPSSFLDDALERFTERESAYERQLRATVAAIEAAGQFEFPSRGDDESGAATSMSPDAVLSEDEGERVTDRVRYRSLLDTHHWTGITAFGLVALATGVLASQPPLILASAVGIGIAGYARVTPPPALTDLAVTRTVSDEEPDPGDEIEVTVTVENTGDRFLPDLTLVDRLPPMMEVVDGSARLGTALRPGRTATFSYSVVAERGEHAWPLQVVGRDASGATEREALIEDGTDGDDDRTVVHCSPSLRTTAEMPVRLQTSVYAGEVDTRSGGEGLEFYSIRDYQPGDPKRRIDWKTYAKTGEFSTVDFRQERAARVVLLFDGRESSYVSPGPGETHAVDRSVDVASDVFASLSDQGHLIGIAAYNGIPCWLGPSSGQLHRQRVRELFVDHPALSSLPPELSEEEVGRYVDPMVHIRRQLPENTQLFLFSPLTDEYTYEVARQLNGAGHLVTVLSPDPTADRTVGQRLARLERTMLIERLRDHGIRVVDWSVDRPLNLELEHARRRWNS